MQALLFFILGSMVGGSIGIVIMCLLQVNRLHDNEASRKEDDDEA